MLDWTEQLYVEAPGHATPSLAFELIVQTSFVLDRPATVRRHPSGSYHFRHHHEVPCDGHTGVGGVSRKGSVSRIWQVDRDVLVRAKQMRCTVELEIPMGLSYTTLDRRGQTPEFHVWHVCGVVMPRRRWQSLCACCVGCYRGSCVCRPGFPYSLGG